MSKDTSQNRAWYDKKRFLIPLLLLLFPVGMYALYKNKELTKNTKIAMAGAASIFFVVVGVTENAEREDAANKAQEKAQAESIWDQPEHLCDLFQNVGLETTEYFRGNSGFHMCHASKRITEMSEATNYKWNNLEYSVIGGSPDRADSIRFDLSIYALDQAEQDRSVLLSHASAVVESVFERDMPQEIERIIKENNTGTWSDEELQITVRRQPFRQTDGEIYEFLIEPAPAS